MRSLKLGSQTYTRDELLDLLDTSPRGDASLTLAHQLIAAKLNLAEGRDPDAIASTVEHADTLLSKLAGTLPYDVAPSSPDGRAMTSDAGVLDRYNNGRLTPRCGPPPAAATTPEPGIIHALLRWLDLS